MFNRFGMRTMKSIVRTLRRSPVVMALVLLGLGTVSGTLRAQNQPPKNKPGQLQPNQQLIQQSNQPPAREQSVQVQPVQESPPLYLDTNQPIERRVEDLLGRMTLEEKLSQVHGNTKFTTPAIPRLGVPVRWLSDGPHGVREDVGPYNWRSAGHTDDYATYMPALSSLGSTWNLELATAYGNVLGQESRKRGKDIILGPIADIVRTPLCGRVYEYFGEDPFLNARMSVNYIRGVQTNDVAACIKHFAGNNQELGRATVNMDMDERTLREIYLPPFEAAIKEAGVWTVMGAYTKFRGEHCAYSDYLINKILKGELGFQGLVMSDWGGTYTTREAVLGGLDLEMGTLIPGTEKELPYDDYYLANPFLEGLRSGEYPQLLLDDKVRRNLRVMFGTHVFDQRKPGSLNTPTNQATALRIAEESIVLLKNQDNLLPLNASQIKSLAVIGENAVHHHATGLFGAGVKTMHEITPLDGILQRAGSNMNITYSVGYDQRGDSNLIERAVAAARQADVTVIIAGLHHARNLDDEGWDRTNLHLPFGQGELIRQVTRANPKTVVVLISGPAIEMDPWLGKAPAVLQAGYPGMEGGTAIARVLFGDVNPSGKLTTTYPKQLMDSPAHALDTYPGTNGTLFYKEGLLVGYRWYDAKDIEPEFPFGFGLSYTTFEYSNLKLVPNRDTNGPVVTAEFEITNTGARTGAEVAELYIHQDHSSLPRPLKELKGFKKISLKPGEKKTVSIPLDQRAFAFYDPAKAGWVSEAGDFKLLVGRSSRDIRLQDTFRLAQTTVEK
jgi:beta-glucosidase